MSVDAGPAPRDLSSLPPPLRAGSDSLRLAVIATNDFHGALEPTTPTWAEGDTIGGAATLAAYIRPVEERCPGATLHLDGGDQMQGTVVSNLSGGRAIDRRPEHARRRRGGDREPRVRLGIDTLQARMAEAEYPFLAANIFIKATGQRPAWAVPYTFLERAGLRIAVIGGIDDLDPVHYPAR